MCVRMCTCVNARERVSERETRNPTTEKDVDHLKKRVEKKGGPPK